MPEAFLQLSITLGIALVLSLAMKFLRQPLIIGYILTGVIVGPLVTGLISERSTLEAFSHIGVALLLFIVGLGLKPTLIREVGKTAVIAGISQIALSVILGFTTAHFLGFDTITCLYLGFVLAFGSTIIILRFLFNKDEQDTLFGKITIGYMLVQDVVAMILFLLLSSSQSMGSGNYIHVLLLLIGRFVIICFALYLIIKFVTPRIDHIFAENKEMLFIFSLAMCFVVATIFYKIGFSLELGALAAGVLLSVSPYQREIAMRIQSLRDFFLIIFFIVMGSNINIADVKTFIAPIVAFSIFVLIINPIVMTVVLRLMKYTARTSFLAGISMSQISEFSLILIGMGVGFGHLDAKLLGPITFVGLITIAVSSYYINYNHSFYRVLKPFLHRILLEKNGAKEAATIKEKADLIMFGCHITGGGLLSVLDKQKLKYILVDHSPETVRTLNRKGLPVIFGSADDTDLLDSLPKDGLKMIISTIPDYDVNISLLNYFKKKKPNINFICVSHHVRDAERLYFEGATYVIMPPYLGRRFIADVFSKFKMDKKKYRIEKERHLRDFERIDSEVF